MVSEAKTVKEDKSRTQVAFLKKQKKGQVNFIDFGQVKNLNIKITNCKHPGTTGQIQNLLRHILMLQGYRVVIRDFNTC